MNRIEVHPDLTARLLSKVEHHPNGCWLWTAAKGRRGYGLINWRGHMVPAHRASYAIFHGDPGDQMVLHDCDTPSCLNPAHLHLGDALMNARESVERERRYCGERRSKRLRDEDVIEILASELPAAVLAKRFGVTRNIVNKIRRGESWRHIRDVPLSGLVQRQRALRGHGEASANTRLSNAQVIAIRADARSERVVAQAYGISPTAVGQIKRRQTWRHL